jgi:hypothetical protein
MKSLFLILLIALVPVAVSPAQSPSPTLVKPPAQSSDNQAMATPSPSATAPIEPPSLIPPNILPAPNSLPQIPSAPDLEQLNTFFKQTSLGKAADEHRLHLQMSALETRIRNDEDLHAAKTAAFRAGTDLERRHRLRSYYQLYYRKLRALANTPELKAYLTTQEAAHEITLLQPRVRHATDEAEATALSQAKAGATVAPAPTPAQAKPTEALPP